MTQRTKEQDGNTPIDDRDGRWLVQLPRPRLLTFDFISKLTAPKSWYQVVIEKRFLDAPELAADAGIGKFSASELLTATGERAIDQVWFFGLQQIGPYGRSLTSVELASIARFMNKGGGVFATGDHQSMGYKLCGEIPRVRSMRRWWYLHENATADSSDSHVDLYDEFGVPATHVPAGIRPAPSASGPLRHDTLVLGTNAPTRVTVDQLRERMPVGGFAPVDVKTFQDSIAHALTTVHRQSLHDTRIQIEGLQRTLEVLAD